MTSVARLFRDPVTVSFVDEDDRPLGGLADADVVPRVGEHVLLAGTPYVVARVGYDVPATAITRIWVVCRPN